jgi:acyl-CoA synthetase (AMP-forming)/AMP-acid ligase II
MIFTSPFVSLEPYPRIPLTAFPEASARKHPDKVAFYHFEGQGYTFAQVWQAIRKTARLLQEKGVKKGDRVAVYSPNSPEYPVAFHGALLAGACVTTINPLYREAEVAHQLEDSEAVALFVSKLFMPVAESVKPKLRSLQHVFALEDIWAMADSVAGEPEPVEIDPEKDLAALPYSSGTTGLPKGVMLTHFNLTSNVRQGLATGYLIRDSVLLDFLPFYHIYGLTILMNSGFAIGATQVVMPRFDPELTLSLVEKHRVTNLFVVPPALLVLANFPDLSRFDTSSLQFIHSGAAPLAPEIGERGREALRCAVQQGYGLTETSPLINTPPMQGIRLESAGPPVSDTEETVVDLTTGQPLGPGEEGEILVRGHQIMQGYWRAPEATAESFAEDGWLRTGDIGYFDEQGYAYIVDRKKEMIKYKGYQVAPAELEALLLEHPGILDAAVIPKQTAQAGEFPKAFVVLRPGATASQEDIMGFVAEKVAPYKKVREVEFVESIPKSLSGKILRRELIDRERQAGNA